MDKKMYFIKTSDKETADKLRTEGFQELPMEGNTYVFLNSNSKLSFDAKNVSCSNKLCI